MIETTCAVFIKYFSESGTLSLAYYSHLIPVFITGALVIFLLYKTKFSLLSKILAFFSFFFCLWLIGDLIAWTQPDYNFISFVWAPLDYINVVFYLFGAYFFTVLVEEHDMSLSHKIMFFVLSLPAWWITFSGHSITAFNQPFCEAFNNESLTSYKLLVEMAVVAYILYLGISRWIKAVTAKRTQIAVVGSALILFFATFSVTEYISSQTGVYEINLYSLFVLPVFLALVIYSAINLKMFQIKFFGMQLLIYIMLIMVGSQFFFLTSTTDKTLTAVTFLLSLVFGYFLTRSIRREQQTRTEIERLAGEISIANEKLKGLDKLKTEFLSLAAHQLRSPLTAIKGYASMLLEGSYGAIEKGPRDIVDRIFQSSIHLAAVIEDLLSVSKIEQGGMQYIMAPFDIRKSVKDIITDLSVTAEKKGLKLTFESNVETQCVVQGDMEKIRQVALNLVDNAIKYTQVGSIVVRVDEQINGDKKVLLSIKDTGMGVSADYKKSVFEKFERGEGGKMNTTGSGLGLYLAKQIVEAHKGKIWLESEGKGKGTTFFVEFKESKPGDSVAMPIVKVEATPMFKEVEGVQPQQETTKE